MSLARESRAAQASRLHPLTAIWTIARKDWLIEWRTRARLTALIFFGITSRDWLRIFIFTIFK